MRAFGPAWIPVVGLAALAWMGARAPGASQDEPPYEELALAWRETHGVADLEPGYEPFEGFQPVLERAFARILIGVFDVRMAKAFLAQEQQAEQLREVCLALIDLQTEWMERLGEPGAAAAEPLERLAKLRKWLARARITAKARSEPSGELIELLGGGERERELAAAASAAMLSGNALGFAVRRERPAQVIFSPTRRDFVSLCSFIGWFDEPWRGSYWVADVPSWTEFYWNDLQVIALQYPPPLPGDDLDRFTPMDEREETGLLQHVAQRAAHSLCWYAFGRTLDPAFESGLAQDLVIGIYGENNARSGGNGRGSKKDGWSMFVPGGLSQGGLLPMNNADSPWREDLGADHFVKVLKLAQREGGKEARSSADKLPFFEITHDDGSQKIILRAPFLGAAAREKPLPPEPFLSDYLEFFRAYKTCFAHWLHEQGAGPKRADSRAKLRELLGLVAASVPEDGEGSGVPGEAFEAHVRAVYGQPLSAEDQDPPNLEWRFLAWLAQQ